MGDAFIETPSSWLPGQVVSYHRRPYASAQLICRRYTQPELQPVALIDRLTLIALQSIMMIDSRQGTHLAAAGNVATVIRYEHFGASFPQEVRSFHVPLSRLPTRWLL